MDGERVLIRDVTLRDGLQLVPGFVPTSLKRRWIEEAARCGLTEMEVTSFVPRRLLPQFADAPQVVADARSCGIHPCVLAPNLEAVRRALDAGADQINFVISATESFNRANLRRSIGESLAELAQAKDLLAAGRHGAEIAAVVSTAFVCPFEGPVPDGAVHSIVQEIHKLGVLEVVLADTIGQAQPRAVGRLLRDVSRDLPTLRLGVHLHDTFGLGMANAFAALDAGVRRFDAALAGLGGCPNAAGASGNLATEDLAFALERSGLSTGLDVRRLLALARSIATHCAPAPRHSHLLEHGVPSQYREVAR